MTASRENEIWIIPERLKPYLDRIIVSGVAGKNYDDVIARGVEEYIQRMIGDNLITVQSNKRPPRPKEPS